MGLFGGGGPKKTRILTVDDSNVILAILRKELEALGYEVIQAKNGMEGIKAAEAQKPDLIFMDITMPEMNGIDALKKLKSNPTTAPIPVLMCTSEQTGKNVDTAFQLGAVGYIIKPFTADRLKAKLNEALPPKPPGAA